MTQNSKQLWIKVSPLPLSSEALSDFIDCGFAYHEKGVFSAHPKALDPEKLQDCMSDHNKWISVLDGQPQGIKLSKHAVQLMFITGSMERVV